MFTNEDKINLRLARTHAENVWSVINVEWDDKDIVDMMIAIAQDKSIEILGEKARRSQRLLQRYTTGIDWRILIKENVGYSHPGDEGLPEKTIEEKYLLLYQFAVAIDNTLFINQNISENHKTYLENIAEWMRVSLNLLEPDMQSEEIRDTLFFYR